MPCARRRRVRGCAVNDSRAMPWSTRFWLGSIEPFLQDTEGQTLRDLGDSEHGDAETPQAPIFLARASADSSGLHPARPKERTREEAVVLIHLVVFVDIDPPAAAEMAGVAGPILGAQTFVAGGIELLERAFHR